MMGKVVTVLGRRRNWWLILREFTIKRRRRRVRSWIDFILVQLYYCERWWGLGLIGR